MRGFTRDVQKVMEIAQLYAEKTGGIIGTEHILVGLLEVEDSYASEILIKLHFTADMAKAYLPKPSMANLIVNSSIVNRALEFSKNIAQYYHYDLSDTQHLLLAILSDETCSASKILAKHGVCYDNVQDIVDSMTYNGVGKNTKDDDISQFLKSVFPNFDFEDNQQTTQNRPKNVAPQTTSTLGSEEMDKLGIDLTQKAKEGKIDPVIGREKEIERIIQILSRRTKNNPVLIGEAGVGKSAIVEGLAQAIVNGDVPEMLKNKKVFSLDIGSLVAGTKYRGDFEERLKNLIDTIKESKNILLFIDEMHLIISAGDKEGGMNVGNILKPMLARGEISTIGATTIDEYRKYVESDHALERRFQPIIVDPPSPEDAIMILKGLREKYEVHHKVKITDEAIWASVNLSDRYIADRQLPDKAIDLIDEACSKARISNMTAPTNVKDLEDKINTINTSIDQAVKMEEFQKALSLKTERDNLYNELQTKKRAWGKENISKELQIDEHDIAKIVSDWTKIPLVSLTEAEASRLLRLDDTLKLRVIGQDDAVSAVARAVKRARAGLKDPKRPIGSFIFLGPTGVGKTELSKALAEAMFGDEDMMIRVDMSEYMEKFNVSRLIGSAPGYVGFDEGGQLTEAVRRKPYSVVLFDEIEKAHPDVFNLLLQVLDDGVLTDSHGRRVSFKNTIIIMTSNIGAGAISQMKSVGFNTKSQSDLLENEYELMKEKQMEALRQTMRPEFINRIDDIIIFRKLDKDGLFKIFDIMLLNLTKRLDERNISIEFTKTAKEHILSVVKDENYGARPLKRTLQKLVEDRLSEEIIKGNLIDNSKIVVDYVDNCLDFNIK